MVIGNAVSGGTAGSPLFVDGSGNLGQNNANYFWDVTNLALGIGNNAPLADMEIQHNTSGNKTAGLTLSAYGASNAVASYLDFVNNRGTRSSPTGPSSGDTAAAIRGFKYNGSIEQKAGGIYLKITGTPSASNLPSEWDFYTNPAGTPSIPTEAMSLDNTQTLSSKHLVVGTASPTADGNAQYSTFEVVSPEPNLGYGFTMMLKDSRGYLTDYGSMLAFGTEYGSNLWTGGSVMQGYKANSTTGDYSTGWRLFTRKNGTALTEAFRVTENQNFLINDTVDVGEKVKIDGLSQDSTNSIGVLTHEKDSGVHAIGFPQLAIKLAPYISSGTFHGAIYSATANGTAYSNSTTQTALTGAAGTGSLTVAANTMYAGETFTMDGWAVVSTASSSPTLDIGPLVSTGSQFNDAILPLSASLSNALLQIHASITILTTGSSGTYSAQIVVHQNGGSSYIPFSTTTGTLNTTASNVFSIQAIWGTASASNSINLITPFILKIE